MKSITIRCAAIAFALFASAHFAVQAQHQTPSTQPAHVGIQHPSTQPAYVGIQNPTTQPAHVTPQHPSTQPQPIVQHPVTTLPQPLPQHPVTTLPATVENFYSTLAPYGHWIDYPGYGQVWHPSVTNFRPYATNGYWEYTDNGWYWNSGYDWGWAPFHYGNWFYDDNYGWLWEPGNDWSPAWVDWGTMNGYYAWAPTAPAGWQRQGYEWNMVSRNNFYSRNLSSALVAQNRMKSQYNRITRSTAPDVTEVQRYANTMIPTRALNATGSKGTSHIMGNTLNAYRPSLSNNVENAQFRKVSSGNTRPVRAGSAWPSANESKQMQNIVNTPIVSDSYHGGNGANGGGHIGIQPFGNENMGRTGGNSGRSGSMGGRGGGSRR